MWARSEKKFQSPSPLPPSYPTSFAYKHMYSLLHTYHGSIQVKCNIVLTLTNFSTFHLPQFTSQPTSSSRGKKKHANKHTCRLIQILYEFLQVFGGLCRYGRFGARQCRLQ